MEVLTSCIVLLPLSSTAPISITLSSDVKPVVSKSITMTRPVLDGILISVFDRSAKEEGMLQIVHSR